VKPFDGKTAADGAAETALPTFSDRVKVREHASIAGRLAKLAGAKLTAATEAEVKSGKYLVIPLIDPATGNGYTEGAIQTLLADRITWISARQLDGFVLDASAIADPEEPVLYYAAGWVATVANDLWGF